MFVFFFKQKTAYEMRISDWSSDVCSSDLINGCKVVLPADRFDGASLQQLIQEEEVTFSGGVPTIWTMYLNHLERTAETTGSLRQIVIGGSAVPRAMAETFQNRFGVQVRQIWGMTEMSPLGVLSTPTPKLAAAGQDVQIGSASGREIVWQYE